MNIFFVVDNELWTPEITDTILSGITRDSLIQLAPSMNLQVKELKIDIDEIKTLIQEGRCTEAFACGTAAVVTPIKLFGEQDQSKVTFPNKDQLVSLQLREKLLHIQCGLEKGPDGWVEKINKASPIGEFC